MEEDFKQKEIYKMNILEFPDTYIEGQLSARTNQQLGNANSGEKGVFDQAAASTGVDNFERFPVNKPTSTRSARQLGLRNSASGTVRHSARIPRPG